MIMALAAPAMAADVTLAWDANSEPDLAGYILFYGTASGQYTQQVTINARDGDGAIIAAPQHTVTGLDDDTTYFFAIKATNAAGNQSDFSDELAYTVRPGQVVIRILDRPVGIRLLFE